MVQAAEGQIDTVFFGNPIQDITVDDNDKTLMTKYKLELGMACLATEEQMPIYEEAFKTEGMFLTPGGSALNSARAQKFSNADSSVAYFGCIGDDDFGKSLSSAVSEAGIDGKFSVTTEHPTGTCAVAVVGKERTLCANIAAAKAYPLQHLQDNLVSPTSFPKKVRYSSVLFCLGCP